MGRVVGAWSGAGAVFVVCRGAAALAAVYAHAGLVIQGPFWFVPFLCRLFAFLNPSTQIQNRSAHLDVTEMIIL